MSFFAVGEMPPSFLAIASATIWTRERARSDRDRDPDEGATMTESAERPADAQRRDEHPASENEVHRRQLADAG